jgi:hypothetical protein
MIDDDDCGAIGGMKIGRGNRSTWRKPAPMPLCPIPHRKKIITKCYREPRTWTDSLDKRPKYMVLKRDEVTGGWEKST